MIAGAGTGILRTMLVKRENVADVIPVDAAINLLIVAGYKRAISDEVFALPLIYNCTSGGTNPITWREIESFALQSIYKFPMKSLLWYPGGSFKKWAFYDRLCRILFHYLPAVLIDACLTIVRKSRFMMRLSLRMTKSIQALEFFTINEWSWSNQNVHKLRQMLATADPESLQTFDFDVKSLNWESYFDHYVLGTRHFVLKEDPETLNSSRKKLRLMQLLHFLVQFAFIFVLYYLFRNCI